MATEKNFSGASQSPQTKCFLEFPNIFLNEKMKALPPLPCFKINRFRFLFQTTQIIVLDHYRRPNSQKQARNGPIQGQSYGSQHS